MTIRAQAELATAAVDDGDINESRYRDWLAATAVGDQHAFAQLYDATAGKAYALALRITGQATLAEEVVTDVYTQVWRQADRYRAERGKALTWLLTICRSRAIDALRRLEPAELVADIELPGESASPLDLLLTTESRSLIHEALQKLDSSQRQLLALAFYRGMTHSELTEYTGIPLGSVKTTLRKSLQTLRSVLTASALLAAEE